MHTNFMQNEMKKSVQSIVKIIGITLAVYAGLRWLLPVVIPFFISFVLAKLLNPMVEKLNKKWKWKRGVWSSILVGLLSLLAILAILIFLKTFFEQVKNVVENMEFYRQQADLLWDNCCVQVEHITGIQSETIHEEVEKQFPIVIKQMQNTVLPSVMNETMLYAKNIFLYIGVCFVIVISTILILKDYQKIRAGLEHHPVGNISLQVCRRTYEAGGAYIKAQFLIMLVITAICVAGLYLSGNKYALLTGCGIGICDAMPFLGTGTIFVPWAIFKITQGEYMMAAIYAVIYAICTLMREILEPKLLGNKLGMPPLTVVVSIYVGLNIYGLWGFMLGPLTYILVREIYGAVNPAAKA